MQGIRIPDNQTPTNPGEYSWHPYAGREVHHPDESGSGEWWVCDPLGSFYRLINSVHTWTTDSEGRLTISPSILSPNLQYHGGLQNGVWS